MRQVLALLVLAWLPGAVLFRLPWLDRERRAALDAEERWFWAVVLSLTLSHGVVLALAAAHRYTFARLLAIDLGIAAAAAAVSRVRLRLGPAAPRPTASAIVPAALLALAAATFLRVPAAEYINGGKDPGVYVNEGVQIAQTGSLAIHDRDVEAVPPPLRDLFFPSHQRAEYYGGRFMGFFIQNPDSGTVMGQFPHFFPGSIAIGYGLDGLNGARRAVSAWAMLGILAVYFAGARLVGRAAAGAGAALLTVNVVEVWFARYPNSEVVLQALLFAALLANARAHVDGHRFFGPVAGLLLGAMLFVSPLYIVLAAAGVFGSLALARFVGRSPQAGFVAVFGLIAALAAWYLFGPMRAYVSQPTVFLSHLPWWEYTLLALAAGGGLAGAAIIGNRPAVQAAVRTWTPTLLIVTLWLLALYALVFRHPGGKLTAYDAYALRHFAEFYLTRAGLATALVGLALAARRRFWDDPGFFATFAVFTCVLFYKIRISPDHFWAARRFLPIILPGALLMAAAAGLMPIGGGRATRLVRTVAGAAVVLLLGWHYALASRPVALHVEYAGLIPELERLASEIHDDDLLVAEARDVGSDIHVLALPLAYVYARHVLVLNLARPPKPDLAEFLTWARTRYRRVLFVGGGGTDLLSHRYGVRPIGSGRFQVPEYEAAFDAYPRGVRQKEFEFGIYEFTPPQPLDARPFDLDVGARDDLNVLRFHAREATAGRTFRWSRATSYVSITVVPPESRTLTMTMSSGGRPPGAPPCDVTISLHGQTLATVRVGDGFAAYRLEIPPGLAARAAAFGDPVELKLVTPVWNPDRLLHTGDNRDLGVMLDRVTVK